jgi:transposase
MRKNNIKTPEEKESIIKEYKAGETVAKLVSKYEIGHKQIYSWLKKYESYGLEGLKSKTGKYKSSTKNIGLHLKKPKNKLEELELEIMKKDIEIARLKKGYSVKGVGPKKEFVITFNKNIK